MKHRTDLTTVSTATGQDLEVEAYKNGSIVVNGTAAESVDVFAANGTYI